MLSAESTYLTLEQAGVRFYTGVPDSLLKDFCAYVTDHAADERHVIAANEGAAGGLAEGGRQDEPQHVKQGAVTASLLDAMGVESAILPDEQDAATAVLKRAASVARESSAPFALVVRAGTFAPYALRRSTPNAY